MLPIFYKYYSYHTLIDSIEERMNLTGNSVHIWRILKLYGTIFSMCHIVGTFFHVISMFEYYYLDENNTWLI